MPGAAFKAYVTCCLEPCDALSLQPLRALLHFELNGLPFVETFVPFRLDSREVHENVLTGLALDETITFCCVEPLDCSLFCSQFKFS